MVESDSSNSSNCTCLDTRSNTAEAQEFVEEAISDLLSVKDELQLQLTGKCVDPITRVCKITAAMIRLQAVDDTLSNVYSSLQCAPPNEDDDLSSNFGIGVKLDIAHDKLQSIKRKHDDLRKEWYSQNEHLNKLSSKLKEKERELRHQSIFCTSQGLILSKMLWKLSKTDSLLDIIVSQEKLILELVQVFAGCLYGFMHTYGDEMPQPSADEYQYVLCLCGVFSNLATTPDGRFLLISQSICLEVYDEIIKILPKVLVPNAENLKWIMLSAIYNLMICKEGEDYAKTNSHLMRSLGECIKPPHPNKIVTLALKIIGNLTNKCTNVAYMRYASSTLPMKRLKELKNSKDSLTIRKHARQILDSVMRIHQHGNYMKAEQLLGVTQLDQSQSRCQNKCTTTENTQQKLHAFYCTTQSNLPNASRYSSCSSDDSESTSSCSLDMTCASKAKLSYTESSFAVPSLLQRQTAVSYAAQPISDYISKQYVEQATSTLNSKIKVPEKLVKSTEMTSEQSSEDEIQSIQYEFPYSNLSKVFNVTIGDNAQNSRPLNNNAVAAFRDGNSLVGDSANMSIVTIYQISDSRAILFSENSFTPMCTQTSNKAPVAKTSIPKDTDTDVKSSCAIKKGLTAVDANTNATSPFNDVDCERSLCENVKTATEQSQACTQVQANCQGVLNMPSTSTGLHKCSVVPTQDQFSTTAAESKTKSDNQNTIYTKTYLKKNFIRSTNNKKSEKPKKTLISKIPSRSKKR